MMNKIITHGRVSSQESSTGMCLCLATPLRLLRLLCLPAAICIGGVSTASLLQLKATRHPIELYSCVVFNERGSTPMVEAVSSRKWKMS